MPTVPLARSSADESFAASRRILVLLWLASAPVLCLLYLKIEPNPDQTQFDYMGWMATQGYPFYSGSFDMNWPGGMILHRIAIGLFGPVPWSWHLGDFLLMQAATATMALFLWRAGFRLAPFVVLALYPPLYVTAGGWMAGQRDIVVLGFLAAACSAMLAPARREGFALFWAGALVACAVMIRPTYLSVLAGLLALELMPRSWVRQPRRHGVVARMAAVLAGFGLVVLSVVLAGLAIGNLDDWYQQSVLFTAEVYAGKPPAGMDLVETVVEMFTGWWHWLSLCGLAGLILWMLRDRGVRYPLMLVLGLAASIMLSYFVQRKGFGYHLAGFLPLLAMLTAVAIDQTAERARHAPTAAGARAMKGALLAVTALAVAGTGAKLAKQADLLKDIGQNGITPVAGTYDIPAADQTRLIETIRARSTPEDRMVQYGTAYQIPYLAQRLPAYRYITPAVELMTPDFTLHAPWMAEIEAGLRESRPRFILIVGTPFIRTDAGLRAVEEGKPVLNAILSHLATGYEVAMQGDFGTLFERVAE